MFSKSAPDAIRPLDEAIQKLFTQAPKKNDPKLANFFTSLLIPENTLERVKLTTLALIQKNNPSLAKACEAVAVSFYALPPGEARKLCIEAAKQKFSESADQKSEVSDGPESQLTFPDGGTLKTLWVNLAQFPAHSKLAEDLSMFLQSLDNLSQSTSTSNPLYTFGPHQSNLQITHVFGLRLVEKLDLLLNTLAEDSSAVLDLLVKIKSPLGKTVAILSKLQEASSQFLPARSTSTSNPFLFQANPLAPLSQPGRGEIASQEKILEELLREASACKNKDDFPGTLRKTQALIKTTRYQNGKSIDFEKNPFVFSSLLHAFHLRIAVRYLQISSDKQTSYDDYFSELDQIDQLLQDTPISFLRTALARKEDGAVIDSVLLEITTIIHSTLYYAKEETKKHLLPYYFLYAQNAATLLSKCLAVMERVNPGKLPMPASLLSELFPHYREEKGGPSLSDLALQKAQEIALSLVKLQPSPSLKPDALVFFKKQDEELEALLQQWEAEDRENQKQLQAKAQAKAKKSKQRNKARQQGRKEKEAKEAQATSPAVRGSRDMLYDSESPQGKYYNEAGALLRQKAYPQAIKCYQQAFAAAEHARDHVMATAAILEVAECLMGQAGHLLAKIQTSLSQTNNSGKEATLAEVCELYRQASSEAKKSLDYSLTTIPNANVDASNLKQVEHLSRSIKTVLENADRKLQETLAFIDSATARYALRLQKLAEGRKAAMQRLGALWTRNPNPKNKERELQKTQETLWRNTLDVRAELQKTVLVLQSPLQEFKLLHPAKVHERIEIPAAEVSACTESALVLNAGCTEMDFLGRIKQLSVAREQSKSALAAIPEAKASQDAGLGQWVAGGSGLLSGNRGALGSADQKASVLTNFRNA